MRSLPVIQPGVSDASPPPFARIGIVGLGLIGGSLALACRRRWPQALVIGVDRNDVLEAAVVRHAIDVAADDLDMLAGAELVVLAAPVEANLALLARLDAHVEGEALVTDVGNDIMSGGPGDDLLFGEVYGERASLIEAGEVALSETGKGDLISGGFGNDFVYGSTRGDALMGFDGHDLIVGGGGDDAIFGDDDYSIATRDWSFTITQGVSVTLNGMTLETGIAPGDDAIYAGTGNDFVYAGGGSDDQRRALARGSRVA